VVYIHNGVLCSHKEENNVIFRKMNGTGDYHVKGNKPDSERKKKTIIFYLWNLEGTIWEEKGDWGRGKWRW
jgi:hypothetical protein